MWIERAQSKECCAEEGTARAVRRDTREAGNVQEWVKIRITCTRGMEYIRYTI